MKNLISTFTIISFVFLFTGCKKDEPKPIVLSKAELQSPADGSKDISNTEVSFTWNISEGGTKIQYDLLFGETENPKTQIASALQSSIYTYKAALKLNTKYYWKVVAKNAEGTRSESKIFSFTTREGITKPALLLPKNTIIQYFSLLELSWQASIGGTGITYDVYYGLDNTALEVKETDLNKTSIDVTESIEKNKVYYWKVVAKNIEGETAESNVFSFTRAANSVIIPTLTSPKKDSVLLTSTANFNLFWEKSVFDSGGSYDLYLDQNPNPTTKVGSDLLTNSFSIANPKIGFPLDYFYWKVVAKDSKGNQVVSEVYKFSTDVVVKTLAGDGTRKVKDGNGTNARFYNPLDIALSLDGTKLYVTELDTFLRVIDLATHEVTTQHYTIEPQPKFIGITLDESDNKYLTSTSHQLCKITPSNQITNVIASGEGYNDGTNSQVKLKNPSGIVADSKGNFYIVDLENHCIRYVDMEKNTTITFAGKCETLGTNNGNKEDARFENPYGIALSPDENSLYVSELASGGLYRIRKIDKTSGQVTTFAGGNRGFQNGKGTAAKFYFASFMKTDKWGNIIVADRENNCVRIISPTGDVSTLAGTCQNSGNKDGNGKIAKFFSPAGIAIDKNGNLYVTDNVYYNIRKITR